MSSNLNSSLAGLSLLSGSLASFGESFGKIESRAVRVAKAQFTLQPITPPWKEPAPSTPLSAQVSAVMRLRTIVDGVQQTGSLPPDVQTAFIAYKALDRLRMLAETAVKSTTSAAERDKLQLAFAKGSADLQAYLVTAPTDKLNIAFGKAGRRAESVAMPPPIAAELTGAKVSAQRADPLAGLTGGESFTVTLERPGAKDVVNVNLAQGPQPPTLDSVASALNAAISSVPMRDAQGNPILDASGGQVPRWAVSFAPTKLATGGWTLKMVTTGIERVSLDQVGAPDALMVAAGQTPLDAPTSVGLARFGDLSAGFTRDTLGTVQARDTEATAEAALLPQPKPLLPDQKPAPVQVMANTSASAVATDANGFTYLVGTTAGDLGNQIGDGRDDLFLTKLDDKGQVVWQRLIGRAGTSSGAALSIAANGDVVVAGTVTGGFDSVESDGDLMVARYSAAGEEKLATVVRSLGADSATSVAAAADGSIIVGGRTASGDGDAFLARIGATGLVSERRIISSGGSETVNALKIDSDGSLLAVTSSNGQATLRRISAGSLATELGGVALGAMDARALVIAPDGRIAVGGTLMNGSDRDGTIAFVDSNLSTSHATELASAGTDQVDSLAFVGDVLFAGGRTTGSLGGPRTGAVDAFVARIDPATGSVGTVRQWGSTGVRMEPVQIAGAKGGDNALSALGFRRGTLNPESSMKLTAQTSLRVGDSFSLSVDDGAVRKITVAADDTLASFARKIRHAAGLHVTVTTPRQDSGGQSLRIEVKPGHELELIAGRSDALAKLGIEPTRLVAEAPRGSDAPRVRPGGAYGLDLVPGLNLADAKSAALALERVQSALSTTQTAFRSLYWDDNKEALVNGGNGRGRVSAYDSAQVARYKDALARLSTPNILAGF